MNTDFDRPAVVLVVSAHDPSGGAGLQADIETITALGARCATLISATTAQNTAGFESIVPRPVAGLLREAELLLSDLRFSACKIGLLGSLEIVKGVAAIMRRLHGIPLVVDPVSHAGAGNWSLTPEIIRGIGEILAPLATIITPNCREARELSGEDDLGLAAAALLELGAGSVLITAADEPRGRNSDVVTHRLYRADSAPVEFSFPRLPNRYHGSGCTLSSAVAARLARNASVEQAVKQALEYTWATLERGVLIGRGQWHPDRFHAHTGARE
ncbi:MAG: bifunctional hydroxymethylpyrimidine kinase/phosphomethylpyrimidine kinase [Gammaproteobacteria bacterium]